MSDELRVDWSQGLVPVIIQDAHTLTVLMLGYMNQEAFAHTQREGLVTFYSRSKQRLWTKGESSGHHLKVVSMHVDCDRDALLIRVHPQGPTCHTGTESCFDAHARVPREGLGFIPELDRIIAQRLRTPQASSYTARLAAEGMARMAQKVGEEGLEIALAAVSGSKSQVVEESADLIFHWLLLLQAQRATVYEVLDVLNSRQTKAPRTEAPG